MGFFLDTKEGIKIPVATITDPNLWNDGEPGNIKIDPGNVIMPESTFDFMELIKDGISRLTLSNNCYVTLTLRNDEVYNWNWYDDKDELVYSNTYGANISSTHKKWYRNYLCVGKNDDSDFSDADYLTYLNYVYFFEGKNEGELDYVDFVRNDTARMTRDLLPILKTAGTSKGFPGDESDTGGGTGDFDGSSDNIDFSELPIKSAVDAGFVTIYTPSTSQLVSLAKYMWTTDFVDVIKKLFGDPMDAILGLSIVPVSVPASTTKEVSVGFVGTGVTMPVASDQYIGFDCGTLNVKEYWGSALDYAPYTKANIFLPYIGFRQLSVDDIMGKAVHLKYRIDILSGACTAQIKCGGSVLYQFSGSCAASLPVSGRDFSDIVRNAISIAGSTGAMIASGGMSAPISAGVVTAGLTTTANNVMGMKPHLQHSGAVSGTGGLLGLQIPFMILERPRQSLPKRYNTHLGYPSNITSKLSALSGYTRVEEIHLENMTCTDKELKEIYQKLREGVII
jgi:hypothetical protein